MSSGYKLLIYVVFLFAVFLVAGCNPETDNQENNNVSTNNVTSTNNNNTFEDKDNDGYTIASGDCNDDDPAVNPGATEIPDGKDNNCNGFVDDDYDNDGYGSASDCDDYNPLRNPGMTEICDDGIDNNCNGLIDSAESDDDGDGFSECNGDCNDNDPKISPLAVEIPGDNIDNNCDGVKDILDEPCDCRRNDVGGSLSNTGANASIAEAIGICNDSSFQEDLQIIGAGSYSIVSYDDTGATTNAQGWGDIIPIPPKQIDDTDPLYPTSCQMLVLFTGEVFNTNLESYDQPGQDLWYTCEEDPAAYIDNAEEDDTPTDACYDLTQVRMVLRTPPNVTSIAFDFLFLSSEYPEYVGTSFNDTFYAIIGKNTVDATHINVSFDGNGKAITVNNNYFQTPPDWTQSINGTGYEVMNSFGTEYVGSATGWLTTKAPVEPNEIYEIIFSIHDEGDGALDSAVVIDNIRWGFEEVEGPITVE